MIGLMKTNLITEYLDEIVSNPHCELNYNKDYELLIAVMLSSQTTDKRVNSVTSVLFRKYDCLEKLATSLEDNIINIIKPLGTYHKKAKNVIAIAKALCSYGYVPNDRLFLESLPGVGRKTANVVLAILYKEKCLAVDTHVMRVSKRLGLVNQKDDVVKVEQKLTKMFKNYDLLRIHHQLILFGRYNCKAKNPNCNGCKLLNICNKR